MTTEKETYAALLRQAEAEITSRWGEGRMYPTRERIEALLDLLGQPQRNYRSIHLTGTNGKTSTARMIDELLRGFGGEGGGFRYPNEIGPGVYDIHSPRVPGSDEMLRLLRKAAEVIPADQLWVNPDCGLKTRGWPETEAALRHMVEAAKALRGEALAR